MKWQEVRQQYPETWVIIEALQAHDQNNKKIIDDISVLDQFKNVMDAMKHYKSLHKSNPQRDILVANTENQVLDIKIQHWFGICGNS